MITIYIRESRTDNCNNPKQLISTNIAKTYVIFCQVQDD